jgi:hypothetical protein
MSSLFNAVKAYICRIWHVSGRRDVHGGFWWGNLKEGDDLEDVDINIRIILKWILKK